MMLRTTVRDCLYLNWALPAEGLPELPEPLRYQLHSWQGSDHVFVSALLFHQDAVRVPTLPFSFGFPQLNLRLYVLDSDGVPSVFFCRMLMPSWVAPGVRLLTHQPASRARLDFPRPSRAINAEPWCWRVRSGGSFEVRAWQESPQVGEGPRLGTWEQTVRYFHERPRGYTESGGELHLIEARHPRTACWPVHAEVRGEEMLRGLLPVPGNGSVNGSTAAWPALHSSWLCPEVPLVFELGLVPKVQLAPTVPHPAAGRMVSPVLRDGVFQRTQSEGTPPERLSERLRVAC
jgi:hypothetical protein